MKGIKVMLRFEKMCYETDQCSFQYYFCNVLNQKENKYIIIILLFVCKKYIYIILQFFADICEYNRYNNIENNL